MAVRNQYQSTLPDYETFAGLNRVATISHVKKSSGGSGSDAGSMSTSTMMDKRLAQKPSDIPLAVVEEQKKDSKENLIHAKTPVVPQSHLDTEIGSKEDNYLLDDQQQQKLNPTEMRSGGIVVEN